MSLSYITIPESEYRALLNEVKRGYEVCGEVAALRTNLQALVGRFDARRDKAALALVQRAIDSCESVTRLNIELAAFERRLRELDKELTPVRPPSRTDIQAAFKNAEDFANERRKPPGSGG